MSKLTRREFLTTSAAAAAPLILPSGVLARPGRPGANDKIVLGAIGVGGMGNRNMRQMYESHPVAAICDVDAQRADDAATWIEEDVDLYSDYRRILDRDDIDAVLIGTPDHWHAVQTVHAVEAGKDVYVEKPLCNSIEEGRAVVDAVERYGAVVQVGSQGRSFEPFWRFCSFIRNGEIGEVNRIDCWHERNPVGPNPPDEDPPPELDWDMWLGPARWRPYNPTYCHSTFRWFMEFGGGNIRDRGAHMLSLLLWAMDRDDDGPVKITATGTPAPEGRYDNPIEMDVTWEFKNPDLTVTWRQPGEAPEEDLDRPYGVIYHGTESSAFHTGGDATGGVTDERIVDYEPPADGVHLPLTAIIGEDSGFNVARGHHYNWFECIKTREQPVMHAGAAHRTASMCILGNLAYLLGRPLEFDPVAQRFINDDQANQLLSSPGRGPWHV